MNMPIDMMSGFNKFFICENKLIYLVIHFWNNIGIFVFAIILILKVITR